ACPLAVAALAVAGDRAGEAARKLEGPGAVVSGQDQGKPVPPEKLQGNLVVFSKDTIVANDKDNKKVFVMSYKLDPARKPSAIDMTISEGPQKGKSAKGIYKLEGDTRRLA